jgi:hypothetical protein
VNRSRFFLVDEQLALVDEQLALTETTLRNALETGQYRNKVRSDFMGGIRSGVNGTPTFFINGVQHDGGCDYASPVPDAPRRRHQRTAAPRAASVRLAIKKVSMN